MKELLFSVTKKDLDISYFSGSGAGGQHRNRHMNCVRIYHKDSGARTTGQSHKEKIANTKEAFRNLNKHPKFKIWMNKRISEIKKGKSLEKEVDEMMIESNLKIEFKENGKWVSTEFGERM